MFFCQMIILLLSVANRVPSLLTRLSSSSFPSPDLLSFLSALVGCPGTHHCLQAYTHAVPSACLLPSSLSIPILPSASAPIKTPVSSGLYLSGFASVNSHPTHIACSITFHLGTTTQFYVTCNAYVPDLIINVYRPGVQ